MQRKKYEKKTIKNFYEWIINTNVFLFEKRFGNGGYKGLVCFLSN